MWYVNSILISLFITSAHCFILTMWYVNIVNNLLDVGAIACFILTMWYVNVFFLSKLDHLVLVLY